MNVYLCPDTLLTNVTCCTAYGDVNVYSWSNTLNLVFFIALSIAMLMCIFAPAHHNLPLFVALFITLPICVLVVAHAT